jgi:transaldolase
MGKFFFDTVDIEWIKKTYGTIWSSVDRDDIQGITTNPSIFGKSNIKTFKDALQRTKELCALITKIRQDDKGLVFVQAPNSDMSIAAITTWFKEFNYCSDGKTKVACKLPPYYNILQNMDKIETAVGRKIDFNVTGLAECSTALMAATYNPKYISVIIGRMEEKGINAKEQINYIRQARGKHTAIITGATRTYEGVKWACEYGTIPTIGVKVFDAILSTVGAKGFADMWEKEVDIEVKKVAPNTTADMFQLSLDFFKQMDELGKDIYDDFNRVQEEKTKQGTILSGSTSWKKGDSITVPVQVPPTMNTPFFA